MARRPDQFCGKCGSPRSPEDKFCPNCGRSFDDPTITNVTTVRNGPGSLGQPNDGPSTNYFNMPDPFTGPSPSPPPAVFPGNQPGGSTNPWTKRHRSTIVLATLCFALVVILAIVVFENGLEGRGNSAITNSPTNTLNVQPTNAVTQPSSPEATQAFSPTSTPQECSGYNSSGKGKTLSVSVDVPEGCVLIIDGYQGDINGFTWGNGGVIAFPAGSYTGSITDGEYQIFDAASGNMHFCEKVNQLRSNDQPATVLRPLSGWSDC